MADVDVIGDRGQRFFSIGVSASDRDGDKLVLTCGGGDAFTDHGDGTGNFEWTDKDGKLGKFTFGCTAWDGKATANATITITVQ